jgi:hypothetical protein
MIQFETIIKKQEQIINLETENKKIKDLLYKWIDSSELNDSNKIIDLRVETFMFLNNENE